MARTAVGVDGGTSAGHRCHERARHRRFDGRPPPRRLEQGFTDREEPRPPFGGRAIEDQSPSVVSIPVAGRAELHVHRRRDHVEHAGEQGPKLVGQGTAGPFRFHGGHDGQFEHEAVVVEGHLAVDAARERVPLQLLLEDLGRLVTPASTLGEPVEGERRHQEAGGLGDHVIVGGRPPAAEVCKILLVPPDLGPGRLVTLEELRCLRPIRRAIVVSRPRRSAGGRSRSRSSSARRRGTDSVSTTSGGAKPHDPRSAHPRRARRLLRGPSRDACATIPKSASRSR